MTKIQSPVEGFTGQTYVGPVLLEFTDGVATFDGDLPEGTASYLRGAGYGLGRTKPTASDAPEVADPRELVGQEQVGTPLRDAAVDPRPEDFLAPTNAGQENPHGPKVVAPGIHAIESLPVRPGAVHVEDLAEQERAETEQAERLLVDGEDVGDVSAAPADADTGPLGLTDPGSVDAVGTGNSADGETPTNPDGTPSTDVVDPADLKGQALDDALEAAGLTKTGTADEKRARLAEHLAL